MKRSKTNCDFQGRNLEPKRRAFKEYFDRAAAHALAAQVYAVKPGFDRAGFVRRAARNLDALEFAGRVQQFADALAATLPRAVPEALVVLTRSLPQPLPTCDSVTDGWLQWPVGQFIADHGLSHFEASMDAMVALTKRFSSEFAVRPFVERRPEETFARLLTLTDDPNPHVRRWCSEGTRPRLPWGKKLVALAEDPSPIWPILEALKDDPERYVLRSVANNLNDIAKDHPDRVIAICREWAKGGREDVIKHALRTLVKAGHPEALAVVGFGPPIRLKASLRVRPRRITIGEDVILKADLETRSTRGQDLLVDYAVHYVRQGGRLSAKVFKWTTTRLQPNGRMSLEKRHRMRPTTIRALYPGTHRVELQVNGVQVASTHFVLH